MRSIRGRLTLWLTSCIALLAIGAGVLLYLYVRGTMQRQFDTSLRERAHVLAGLLRIESNGDLGMDFSDQTMPEYLPGRHAEYFEAADLDGRAFERSLSLREKDLTDLKQLSQTPHTWNLTLPDGRPGRAVLLICVPHFDEEDRDEQLKAHEQQTARLPQLAEMRRHPPKLMFIAARDRTEIDRASTVLISGLSVSALGLALACVIMVRLIVSRELRPVDQVAAQASKIGPETLDYRFDVQALPQELHPICERLNDVLGRLDQAFRRERRLNADIAHELRTPIAELRSLTEVASLWPGDERQMSIYLHDAHDVAIRMESIVERLLSLARSQAGRIVPRPETIDVCALVRELVEHRENQAAARDVRVDCELGTGQTIRTDRTMLTQIVDNLLANAIQYSPAGGRVTCRIQPEQGGGFALKISNANATLTSNDLPKIFEPFWRKDGSRSDGAHSGLGLTLVREFAQLLGLTVSADLPQAGSFEVSLFVPVASMSPEVSDPPARQPVMFPS